MIKEIIKNFFRKDLGLQNKWWHRLILIIFTFWIIFIVWIYILDIKDIFRSDNGYVVTKVSLKERVKKEGSRLQLKDEYLKEGEVLGDNYWKNTEWNEEAYCANTEVLSKDWIKLAEYYSIPINKIWVYPDYLTKEQFTNYIKLNDIVCLTYDTYFDYKVGSLKESYLSNLFIQEYSISHYLLYAIINLLLKLIGILIAVIVPIFIYYKGIIYIIYGKKVIKE